MAMTSQSRADAGDVRHALDEDRLAAYLREHVQPFDGTLTLRQFSHGQSNPTSGARVCAVSRVPF